MADSRTIQFATPEKALLDLLYLYPFYDSEQELEELRLDEDYLHDDLNKDLLIEYCAKFQSKALDHRVKLLFKTYDLWYKIHFPELLFDLGLSGHKEERFLIKVESQDQGIVYPLVLGDTTLKRLLNCKIPEL